MPSTPAMPIPSTMSRVSRNGTVSGVGKMRPCSNATPRSMWTSSAVRQSIRMFCTWRSPSPRMYPTGQRTHTDNIHTRKHRLINTQHTNYLNNSSKLEFNGQPVAKCPCLDAHIYEQTDGHNATTTHRIGSGGIKILPNLYILRNSEKQIAQVLNHDLRYYKKNLVLLILCRCAQWLRLMTITLVNWCSVAKKWVVSLDEHSNNMPVKSRIKFMAVKTSGFFQLWSLTNIVLRSRATDHSPLSKCCHTYNLSLYIIVLLFRTDWVSQKRTFEKNWSSFTSWMSFQSPNQQC